MATDPTMITAWADSALSHEAFWWSAPRWHPTAARGVIDGETFVWVGDAVIGLPRLAAVLAEHFDGAATLGELAEDLAYAADMPLAWARGAIVGAVTSLAAAGAVESVALPDPPRDLDAEARAVREQGKGPVESTVVDPETGETIRVTTEVSETGNVVTTEHLPDGRRRISSTMTIGSDSGNPVAEQVLIGDRSPAELVPRDSCLGSKLRNDDDVPLLSFHCRDGQVRSVRCHSDEVADVLRGMAGDRLVQTDERGPIVAFVVTPLEGRGPVRIYDGQGRRRGRPSTVSEAARVVDGLLGAHREAFQEPSAASLLPLRTVMLRRGMDTMLVPDGALDDPVVRRAWRRDGWEITWVNCAIGASGALRPLRELTPPEEITGQVVVSVGEQGRADDFLAFVALPPARDAGTRQALLTRACAFLSDVRKGAHGYHSTTRDRPPTPAAVVRVSAGDVEERDG